MSPSVLGQTRRRPALWGVPLLLCAFLAGSLLESSPVPPRAHSAPATPSVVSSSDLGLAAGETSGTFRVASFNVLGANHTGGRGTHAAMASGATRTGYLVRLLDLRGLDVAGLQEFQRAQYDKFMGLTKGAWSAYPGNQLSNYATHNSIIWRTSEWELLQAKTLPIPYFNGKTVPMPYVLLRNVESQRLVWFANFHNPASGKRRGDQAKWRAQAAALEIALANRLWESGVPLILTGDMNEQSTYFCKMTTQAPMRSANGGSFGTSTCKPPAERRIDWVFGSNYVQFSDYGAHRGALIKKTSDHPMVVADVTVPLRPRS